MINFDIYNSESQEQELVQEFQTSKKKSFHAFLISKDYTNSLEAKFWEWMETPVTKYNKDGQIVRSKSNEGYVYKLLMKPFSKYAEIFILSFLVTLCLIVTGLWIIF